jgi:hypothetical protein
MKAFRSTVKDIAGHGFMAGTALTQIELENLRGTAAQFGQRLIIKRWDYHRKL